MNNSILHIFRQTKPIKAVIYLKNKNKIKLYGFAGLIEKNLLQVQFPKSSWPPNQDIDWQKNIFICLEEKKAVISVYAYLKKELGPGNLLLKPIDYVQYKDRRDSPRVSVENIVTRYQPLSKKGSSIGSQKNLAKAENISKSGILLQIQEVIKPDEYLSLEIILPKKDQKSPVLCTGKVIRLALQPDGNLEVALRFEHIAKKDQEYLTDFFQSYQPIQ